MGNNPSAPPKSSSASPASSTHGSHSAASDRRREPKLRDTIQSQRGAAPPESSKVQARGTTVPHHTRNAQSQHAQLNNNGQYSHSPSPKDNSIPQSSSSSQPLPQQTPPTKQQPLPPTDEPSKPVAVPQPVHAPAAPDTPSEKSPYSASQSDQSGLTADIMSYHLTRPPRLPLPIEEEVHTPGSPILGPASSQGPVPEFDPLHGSGSEGLTRPLSALSNTTEDDEGDELPIDRTKPVVPTEFHWFGPAEKVYVTGTIFQWSRKSKLYPM